MGIKYIGERISPHSKFSVQYGIVYENNVPVTNPEKIKKVMDRYEYAVKNNWIVIINIADEDRNSSKLAKSSLIEKQSLDCRRRMIPHYVIKRKFLIPWTNETEKNKHKPPFHINYYRDFSLKFTKRKATVIKNLLLKEGIINVSIAEYHPGLTGEHLGYEPVDTNSITTRFSLMDFD